MCYCSYLNLKPNKSMKYLFTYIILFVFYIPLFAQNNPKKDMPTIDDVMKQMENIKTDNKPNTASKSNKSSTKPNSTARSTKDFYFNKKMIDEHFSKLTAEEKSWFSNIPPIPERFYTSNDAQEFLKKSNGFSMIKFLSEHSTKNIQIISFISSLEKVMVIARLIVAAGENSKLEFEKNNP